MAVVDLFEFLHFDILDGSLDGQWACVAESSNRGGRTRPTTNQPHLSHIYVITSTSTSTRATANQPQNVRSSELEA